MNVVGVWWSFVHGVDSLIITAPTLIEEREKFGLGTDVIGALANCTKIVAPDVVKLKICKYR